MYRLEMKGISKSFGGVHALKAVDLQVNPGEVHALIGENGAGKSTLMKVLSGAIVKDCGEIIIDGKPVFYSSPKQAMESGISVIYQELNMAPDLTVGENIFLGSQPRKHGCVLWREMFEKSEALLRALGSHLSPKTLVQDLPVASQQFIEIARAIKNKSSIIVFDEPSAVLGKADSEVLFEQIAKLKASGVSIIYISHRLDEVLRITDKVTVLRDGQHIATEDTHALKMNDLIVYMTGKSDEKLWPEKASGQTTKEVVFEVKNLCRGELVKNVSFSMRKGEVLGLAGLVGSGRSEIARAIFGADKKTGGEFFLHGKQVQINKPADAIKNGIGFVVEDRKRQGLLLNRPIYENITITGLKKYARANVLSNSKEHKGAGEFKEKLLIKTKNIDNPASSLSGGNQQKVALAKWLHIEPEILFLDEPTRGVDVGAKYEIYKIIAQLKEQGKAILLISSEFAEILGLSDRIVVVRRGEIVGEFTGEQAARDSQVLDALAEQGGMRDVQ